MGCLSVVCFSSMEKVIPVRFNLRRTSSRSLRLLFVLVDGPGALTPSFNRRAPMYHGSLGM